MKMQIVRDPRDGVQVAEVEHRGEKLVFNINTYSKTSERSVSVNVDTMFDEFNQYVATLPAESQQTMFDAYKDIAATFEKRPDLDSLTSTLVNLVAKIYPFLDQTKIRAWIVNKSHIRIPTTLEDHFNNEETQEFRNRTYLRTHYLDLAAFALSLRAMVPIWGQYIHACEASSGSNMKEFVALQLLYKTGLTNTPAFERLATYIQAFIDSNSSQGRPKAAPILTGLGTADMCGFLLSKTIVRRLCIGELSSANDTSHIITNLYQYIFNGVRDLDRKFSKTFGGRVRDKKETIRNSRSSDEQSVSVVEMYKIVQPISDGDVVILSIFTEYVEHMAQTVDPTVDMDKLRMCLESVTALQNEAILPHQVTMAQWILHKVMSPKAGQSLNKEGILRAIAVSQALLWHWELYDLAGLITATKLHNPNTLGFGYNETRTRIRPEMAEEFQRMTPHYQLQKGRNPNPRTATPVARSIEAFSQLISHSDWRLNCHEKLLSLISGRIERTRKMIVPGDIRNQVGRLLIKVNEGQY